jgi:hypothetical protein
MVHKRLLAVLATGPLLFFSANSSAQDWSFEFEPYILASTIEGDAGIGRVTGVEVDVDLSDILEVLDMAFMGHFEVHHNSGWGMALDYGFMDLSADISGPLGGVLDAKVRQGVLEALLVRRVTSGDGHIDYLAGIRWWDNDIDATIDPAVLPGTVSSSVEEDWVDLVIGARWMNPLNDRWDFHFRGDIGGLGLESDFTSALAVGFRYQMTESMDLDLQYKATWVDFESGTPGQPGYFKYDTVTHGPLIGVIFNF